MKKLFLKTISCIIVASMLLSSFFGVISFAEDDPNDPGTYLNNTATLIVIGLITLFLMASCLMQ